MNVVVVGAGIVGVCTALELIKAGAKVTIVESESPGGEQSASHGNGAWLSPASVVPMSMPGLWKKVPGYLLDRSGPLTIRWKSLPGLASWLLKFTLAGSTTAKVERTSRALNKLLRDAPSRHMRLAEEAGLGHLIRQDGLLYAYPDKAAFAAEALSWRLRQINGVRWQEWDERMIKSAIPYLASKYKFGAWVQDGAHCLNPGEYVGGLVSYAVSLGADFIKGTVTKIDAKGSLYINGELVTTDKIVVACGIHSRVLAKMIGDDVPMRSERGYNVVIKDPKFQLAVPVMPSDGRMANTSTNEGLRLSGQVELADENAAPDWRRSDILLHHAADTYPSLVGEKYDPATMTRWMGKRPSTSDGLPVISPSRASSKVVYAFGHGHVGLAAAPKTAEIISQIVMDRTVQTSYSEFSVNRFYGGADISSSVEGRRGLR
ncbi:NAD(P)/FAD-dependent oxidoreductase [Pseudomonas asiatica]|uniref:NAD(P)/FAD-dependent oxidoreductase n=1 Tax=Pseudomonas asiatica TaxID=2219225 RepID=UPI0037CA7E0F